jgi:hypothetical protein
LTKIHLLLKFSYYFYLKRFEEEKIALVNLFFLAITPEHVVGARPWRALRAIASLITLSSNVLQISGSSFGWVRLYLMYINRHKGLEFRTAN